MKLGSVRCRRFNVLEGKILETVLVKSLLYVKYNFAVEVDVAQHHVGRARVGHILAPLQVEELCPGFHIKHAINFAAYALHGNVLVVLFGIRTHLEPKHSRGILYLAIAQDDVIVVQGFAATSEHAMTETISAVLNDDVAVLSVVYRVFVCPGSFSAF